MNAETLKQYPPEQRCFYLLGLQPGATREALRAAYRRLSLRYHPDRPGGGDANKFLLVSKAYTQAIQVLEHGRLQNAPAPTHHELRTESLKSMDPPAEEKRVHHRLDPQHFNVDHFNETFASFHIQEPWMRGGYEVETGGVREEQPSVRVRPELLSQTQKATSDTLQSAPLLGKVLQKEHNKAFHHAFEQEVRNQHAAVPRKDIMLYQDPKPMGGMSFGGTGGGFQPAVLDEGPEDFTDDGGKYTDYLRAHTVYNLCTPADLDGDWTPPARTLESVKASREKIEPMSDDERAYLERREQEERDAEAQRLARLREYDRESEKRYLESHLLMLGHGPGMASGPPLRV